MKIYNLLLWKDYILSQEDIKKALEELPNLESVAWVQEEPKTKAHGYLFTHILNLLLDINLI